MNKQELQNKYREILLETNDGNDEYVVALCKIANAINELEEMKDLQSQLAQQKAMWNELKEWIEKDHNWNLEQGNNDCALRQRWVLDKIEELEQENKNEKI